MLQGEVNYEDPVRGSGGRRVGPVGPVSDRVLRSDHKRKLR